MIGPFIRKRRIQLSISQTELARELGMGSGQFISNIERGRSPIPLKYVPKLARILKVNKEQIAEILIEDYKRELKSLK